MYTNHALIQYSYDRYIESLPPEKQAFMSGMSAPLMGGLIGGGLGLGAAALSGKKNKPWLRNLLIGAGLGGLGGYGYDKFQDFQASQQGGGSKTPFQPQAAWDTEEATARERLAPPEYNFRNGPSAPSDIFSVPGIAGNPENPMLRHLGGGSRPEADMEGAFAGGNDMLALRKPIIPVPRGAAQPSNSAETLAALERMIIPRSRY